MLLARRWAGALVVEDTVFVIGGIGGKGGTYEKRLDSVESLELSEDGAARRWRQLAPMSTPRSSHTCEVMDGLIYVVGGGDGKDWLCSAEVYDPKKNVWRSIADLSAKRWKCGLVELGGYLYAVGGMDSPRAGFWGAPLNTGTDRQWDQSKSFDLFQLYSSACGEQTWKNCKQTDFEESCINLQSSYRDLNL